MKEMNFICRRAIEFFYQQDGRPEALLALLNAAK